MTQEIWKPVPGYEGDYEASNLGRIRSFKYNPGPRIRKHGIDGWGYPQVGLSKNNISKTTKLHRIIAELFVPNPENKTCVNHKDGNKLNNCADNLEWVTYAENTRHAFDTGLIPIRSGHTIPKLSYGNSIYAKKVINIKTKEVYDSARRVCEMIGMKSSAFRAQLRGDNINNTGFMFLEDYERQFKTKAGAGG